MSVWLREAGVERSTLAFFSWAGLAYSLKFVWSPLVDRLPLPWLTRRLGRRRAWLLVSQAAIAGAVFWTSSYDPRTDLSMTALGVVLIAFASATQDIVVDAYRIESADERLQSTLSAMYVAGYRLGRRRPLHAGSLRTGHGMRPCARRGCALRRRKPLHERRGL